jgi:integrase
MGRKYTGVRTRTSKSIEITFNFQGERYHEVLKLEPTPSNLMRASHFRSEILAAIDKGEFDYKEVFPKSKNADRFPQKVDPRHRKISAYLTEWLEKKKRALKSSTYNEYYKVIIHNIIPNLGNIKINELKRVHVIEWVSELDVSNKRISNLISPLRAALQDAVQNDLIEKNPLYGWNYKKQEAPKKSEIDPFNAIEQAAILEAAEGQIKNFIQFAFWTGLRISEQIALEWPDIDFHRRVVHINKAKTYASKEPEAPKTRSGIREVKLLDPALRAIEDQFEITGHLNGPIFRNPRKNQPWTCDRAIRDTLWKPTLKKAGVRYRYPYQTRHTYASMLLSAGEPLSGVSYQMGHSSVVITSQAYARWIPDAAPNFGSKALTIFSDQKNDQNQK